MASDRNETKALIPAGGNPADGTSSTRMLVPVAANESNAGGAEENENKGGFTPTALLQAFFQVWRTAVLTGMVLGLIALVSIWFLRPPVYTAYAVLRVHGDEQSVLDTHSVRRHDEIKMYMESQAALIKSRRVINAALKNDKIRNLPMLQAQSNPGLWLENSLKSEFLKGTDVLILSLSQRFNVEDMTPIVDAIQKNYIAEIVEGEKDQRRKLLEDMEAIQGKAGENLRAQREKLRTLSNDLKTSDSSILTMKQKNLYEEYAQLKLAVLKCDDRIRDLQVKLDSQNAISGANNGSGDEKGKLPALPKSLPGSPSQMGNLEQVVDNDPGIAFQLKEVRRLEAEIQQIESVSKNPDNKILRAKVAQLEKAKQGLDKVRDERRKTLLSRYQEMVQGEMAGKIQEASLEMKSLTKIRNELKAEVEKKKIEVESIGLGSVELESQRNEIEQTEAVFKDLRRQKERLQIELQSTINQRVTLLAPVLPAEVLSKMTRYIELAVATLGGLFLGILGISLNEYRKKKIYSPACMGNKVGVRVIGTTPNTSNKSLDVRIRQQVLLDSVDSLRTRILQSAPEGTSRILMITSAWSGEGKTTLSKLLVASIARAGRRCLLIDCDLRCPSLNELLDLKLTPGLSEVLTEKNTLEESIQTSSIPGVSFLAAGEYSSNAAMALARQSVLTQLFHRLREQFDFILVDTSPILAMPDTLMVCSYVDGVILAVRSGISQAVYVNAAYENLRQAGVPFVGAVVNGITEKNFYGKYNRYPAARSTI